MLSGKVCESNRGKPRFSLNGYNYFLKYSAKNGKKTWRCINNKCPAKVITFREENRGIPVKAKLMHSCVKKQQCLLEADDSKTRLKDGNPHIEILPAEDTLNNPEVSPRSDSNSSDEISRKTVFMPIKQKNSHHTVHLGKKTILSKSKLSDVTPSRSSANDSRNKGSKESRNNSSERKKFKSADELLKTLTVLKRYVSLHKNCKV